MKIRHEKESAGGRGRKASNWRKQILAEGVRVRREKSRDRERRIEWRMKKKMKKYARIAQSNRGNEKQSPKVIVQKGVASKTRASFQPML